MISLNYKDSRSLHEQIEAGLKELIINGVYSPDQQLPSVRELSVSLTVNPNTVQRAYKMLENEGFIYSIKGRGNFVAKRSEARDEKKTAELYNSLAATVKELMYLGEGEESINNLIRKIFEEGKCRND